MSRVNFGAKPFIYPMPVLIVATYDENGVPNAMNAAWGTITDMSKITQGIGCFFIIKSELKVFRIKLSVAGMHIQYHIK